MYVLEFIANSDVSLGSAYGINNANPRMLLNHLVPANFLTPPGFELVRDGTDENSPWKLNLKLQNLQVEQISFFLDNYKSYYTGLTEFRKRKNSSKSCSAPSPTPDDLLVWPGLAEPDRATSVLSNISA